MSEKITLFIDALTPSSSNKSLQDAQKNKYSSMLVTGFGMRNVESFEKALFEEKQRQELLISKYAAKEQCEQLPELSSSSSSYTINNSSLLTERKDISVVFGLKENEDLPLQYLLEISENEEEYQVTEDLKQTPSCIKTKAKICDDKMTLAMKKANDYLKQHKIFEFFKFLIAHLLNERPENPVEFLINLLDKCLLYRSGFGNPPLLFEKPHIGILVEKYWW